jgi:hypothetical protein
MLWDAPAPPSILTFETFSKKACRIEEIFVPLQCQMKEVAEATIKDKNCEH